MDETAAKLSKRVAGGSRRSGESAVYASVHEASLAPRDAVRRPRISFAVIC